VYFKIPHWDLILNIREACGAVGCVLVFGSGVYRFKPHCSQHVVVSLGKTLHPKLLLW